MTYPNLCLSMFLFLLSVADAGAAAVADDDNDVDDADLSFFQNWESVRAQYHRFMKVYKTF